MRERCSGELSPLLALRNPPIRSRTLAQLNATHSNLKQYVMELRLDLHTRIRDVKTKLLTHNGTSVEHMLLQLQDADGTPLRMMDDDDKPLGFYSPQNGMTIHVIDTDPFSLSRDGTCHAQPLVLGSARPTLLQLAARGTAERCVPGA